MARLGIASPLSPQRPPMTSILNMDSPNFGPIAARNRSQCDGISFCGLCICCTCIHLEFLKRAPGIFKIAETTLGVICQFLVVQFGSTYAQDLGESYIEFLVSVSSCLMTTALLLACYVLSKNTYHLIRSSIFETAFNIVACFLYITSSAYLAFALNTRIVSHFTFLPSVSSITAAYTLGLVVGVLHGIDAYLAWKNSIGIC